MQSVKIDVLLKFEGFATVPFFYAMKLEERFRLSTCPLDIFGIECCSVVF